MSAAEGTVKIRAYSPGRYPILVVELADNGLRTVYYETGYDLGSAKEVEEGWLRDNAIGRHSFVEVNPPREMHAGSLEDYVNRELLEES
jgi:Uma2 family endonuclease